MGCRQAAAVLPAAARRPSRTSSGVTFAEDLTGGSPAPQGQLAMPRVRSRLGAPGEIQPAPGDPVKL